MYTIPSTFEGNSEVEFYVQIPNQNLTFKKHSDSFSATIEILLSARLSKNNNQVYSHTWTIESSELFYEDTRNADIFTRFYNTIKLPFGDYIIDVIIRDIDNKTEWKLNNEISVAKIPLWSKPIPLIQVDEKRVHADKIISDKIDTLYYKIHLNPELDISKDSLTYIMRKNDYILYNGTQSITSLFIDNSILMAMTDIDKWVGIIDVELALRDTSQTFTTTIYRNKTDKFIANKKQFSDVMRYILTSSEYTYLSTLSIDEQREFIVNYWKQMDPTPKTDHNEIMEEFYDRIDYVNERFGNYGKGWKSDRGRVHIVNGKPDNIETYVLDSSQMNPLEIGVVKTYEQIWTYSHNKKFIFRSDRFGDYHLIYEGY
jgi:GWxTD domain-containing protein